MSAARTMILCATLTPLAACWHATVETGLVPSTQVVEQKFASSWIYGLVPPKTVETARRCPEGVARVETQLSFLNQVVHILTFGIYTPMHIRVTCALPPGTNAPEEAMLTIPAGAAGDSLQAAFSAAADRAVSGNEVVIVRLER